MEEDTKQPDVPFKLVKTDDCAVRYIDVCVVDGTLYGFQIHLGRRGLEEPKPIRHEISAVIHMSPQHLKDMACVLLDNVLRYEQKFGEINSQFVIDGVQIRKREEGMMPILPPAASGGIQA